MEKNQNRVNKHWFGTRVHNNDTGNRTTATHFPVSAA